MEGQTQFKSQSRNTTPKVTIFSPNADLGKVINYKVNILDEHNNTARAKNT